MALPVWHEELPQFALRDGYRGVAGVPFRRAETDAGRARQRGFVSGPALIDCRWRMSAAAFRRFKAFYSVDLREGTRWFSLPLWFGGADDVIVPAQFVERYAAEPRAALSVTVTAQLHVRHLPYSTLAPEEIEEFYDAEGRAVWPAALPAAPLRTGLVLDPHRNVLTTDIDGPTHKRDLFGPSPASMPVSWSMDVGQFDLFKAFWFDGLARGNRWFIAPLWFGRGIEHVAARCTTPFAFEPHGADRVLVAVSVETRRLPVASPGALALLNMMGEGGVSLLGGGIHEWVHETWPLNFGEE